MIGYGRLTGASTVAIVSWRLALLYSRFDTTQLFAPIFRH